MFLILSTAILTIALLLLAILSVIDLKIRLLPNIYVFPFGLLGIAFHALHEFSFVPAPEMLMGALGGGGLLLLIRTLANAYYKQDTLGLGDVKLMTAAGLWLGLDHIFIALSLGAGLGVLHGLIHAAITRTRHLKTLSIPAGPGFIGGIILTFLIKTLWT
jgi:leader peptidase (prepilin peptidase) / N-methyltransferase